MKDQISYPYKKLLGSMETKFYPREVITTVEFKETSGQVLNSRKNEWLQLAKDLKKLGIIELSGKGGISKVQINWHKINSNSEKS